MIRFSIGLAVGLSLTILALLASVAFLAGQLRVLSEIQLSRNCLYWSHEH